MQKRLPIFYSALLLTAVNLLLRLIGTSFQVYISGRIGAAGVGLLQLIMSVGSLALVAGMAGIRTATMYLTAEDLGRKQPENTRWVLSGCRPLCRDLGRRTKRVREESLYPLHRARSETRRRRPG